MMEEIVFKGWSVRHRNRQTDVDKNPVTEWRPWNYRSASRSVNPYVYQKGRHYASNSHKFNPIHDYSNPPIQPTGVSYSSPEMDEWRKVYREWHKNLPITGYYEIEVQVVKTKIVIDNE